MRVLAVTSNASLVVALGSMMREWEVVTVRDVEHAAAEGAGSVVALIDLGDTGAGIEMADQLYKHGVTVPCVVVGDVPAADQSAAVLVRPFSLEELGTAVRDAAARPTRATVASPPRPSVVPVDVPPVQSAPAPAPVEAPPARSAGNGTALAPVLEPEPEPVAVEPTLDEASAVEELPVEPAFPPVVEPLPEPEPVVQAYAEPAARPVPTPTPAPAPVPVPAPVTPQPLPAQPRWEEPDPNALRPVFHEPQPAEPAKTGWRKRRREAARHEPAPETESPIVRRLKVAALHALELEDLISQMPFLADLQAMAAGLVTEIDREFVCSVASVTVRREEGFSVVAHRGLSKVESGMVVLETQPMFSDVLKTRDGVLLQPVDLAQGLVAGIGGARTEALMVAPGIVNNECVAIVVVGGDSFTEMDLDRLSNLAAEAAPGLAVALLLDRLRHYY